MRRPTPLASRLAISPRRVSGVRTLLGQGLRADVYEWEPGLVVKVLVRDAAGRARAEREANAMRATAGAGLAPQVREVVEVDGYPGVVMEKLVGTDLLARLGARPWTVFATGRMLGALQARINAVPAPPELPEMTEWLDLKLASPLVPSEVASWARAELERLPQGDCVCHDDLHPGNVVLTAAGARAIDWANAARGPAAADVGRTLLILRMAAVPGHAPRGVRLLHGLGRSALAGAYLRSYRRTAPPIDRGLVERWVAVRMADRLAEDIPEEREALLAALRR